jgi:hypothetical protein
MTQLQDAANLVVRLGHWVLNNLAVVQLWLQVQLTRLHVPPQYQTVVLAVVIVLLMVVVIRVLAGPLRIIAIMILLQIVVYVLLPVMNAIVQFMLPLGYT